jgi:hypothetical protein
VSIRGYPGRVLTYECLIDQQRQSVWRDTKSYIENYQLSARSARDETATLAASKAYGQICDNRIMGSVVCGTNAAGQIQSDNYRTASPRSSDLARSAKDWAAQISGTAGPQHGVNHNTAIQMSGTGESLRYIALGDRIESA